MAQLVPDKIRPSSRGEGILANTVTGLFLPGLLK